MMYILQRKSDKLFYTENKGLDKNIEKARIFKRKSDLFLFFNCKKNDKIFVFYKAKAYYNTLNDYEILTIEYTITGKQTKLVAKEYKTKQLLKEIEK